MKHSNIIAVFNKDYTRVLMCLRRKDPYMGKYNFVGGKVKAGKDNLSAAYRELFEETGITVEKISLTHFMDFTYYEWDICLELYVGILNDDVAVYGEENELFWISLGENFFDTERFAGEGNIGHMMLLVDMEKDKIFN